MKYSDAFRATMKSLMIPMLILIVVCIIVSSWSVSSARSSVLETFESAGSAALDPSVLVAAGGANAVSVPAGNTSTSGIVSLALPSVASPPPGVMQTPGTPAIPSPTQAPVTAPAGFPSLTGTTTPLIDPFTSQLPPSVPNVANSIPQLPPMIPGVIPNTSTAISTSGGGGLNSLAQLTTPLTLPGQGSPTPSGHLGEGQSPSQGAPASQGEARSQTTLSSQLNPAISSIPGLDFNMSSSGPTMPATGISTNASKSMPFSATVTNTTSSGLIPGLTNVNDPSVSSADSLSAFNPPYTNDATKPTPLTVWNTDETTRYQNGSQPSMPPPLAGNAYTGVKPYADTSKEAYDLQRYAPLFDELNEVQKELFDNVQRLRNVSGKIRSQYVPSYPLPLMEVSAGY